MDSSNKNTQLHSKRKVQKMVNRNNNRDNKRNNRGDNYSNDNIHSNRNSNDTIRGSSRIQSTLLKKLGVPFAVLSTSFLTGASHPKAESSFWENGNIENNPFSDKGFNFNLFGLDSEQLQGAFSYIVNSMARKASKFDEFTSEIMENSIKFLAFVYETLVTTIIQTPAWVFENTWFLDSYAQFTLISVIAFTFFALVNAGKRMFLQKSTDLKDVIRRYFMAVIGIGFGTFAIQQFTKAITALTKIIVSLGYHQINSKDFETIYDATTRTVDTISLVSFDIVLAGLMVTALIQNGRRWFQLGALGVTTPLALSAWVFDDKKHFFTTWKTNFVKLSLTQLYYSFFITLMGGFIAGTSGVLTAGGLIIKLSMVAGGLTVMATPPAFVNNLIDNSTDNAMKMMNRAKTLLTLANNPAYTASKIGYNKVMSWKNKLTK